ncbi:septation protein SepH [Cellulomonas sp. P5_C6]
MGELELVGLHEDGEHLVLVAPDGARFRLRIDEPLRAAVRRDRPQLEQLRAESAGTLSPREIQARIRAGATTQEVADDAGLPIERVRRYEGPVLAEREHIAEQARGTRVGRDIGAPTLGDLVTDRLAARGVDLGSLAWDAARDASGPWVVLARFAVGDAEHEARWTFDPAKRTVVADEDEARWLSETEIADEPVSRRHLAAVRDVVFDFQGDVPTLRQDDSEPVEPVEPTPDPHEETASLLDDLRSRRGVRQAVELGDEDDDDDAEAFEGFGPQHAFDFGRLDTSVPGAHPVDAPDEAVVYPPPAAVPEPVTTPAAPAAEHDETERPRGRRGRAKVPSWDEIVFGAKPE